MGSPRVAFRPTEIAGVLEIDLPRYGDDRGYFMEAYNKKVWQDAGFEAEFVQDNMSKSAAGVLRGLHYQIQPHGMGKLVRAITGRVFDVAVDLRRASPTFGQWAGRELSAENGLALWIPSGFAHGFLSLEDDTIVYYKCTYWYTPEAERSLNWQDPKVNIDWPEEPASISPKDAAAPYLNDAEYNFVYDR